MLGTLDADGINNSSSLNADDFRRPFPSRPQGGQNRPLRMRFHRESTRSPCTTADGERPHRISIASNKVVRRTYERKQQSIDGLLFRGGLPPVKRTFPTSPSSYGGRALSRSSLPAVRWQFDKGARLLQDGVRARKSRAGRVSSIFISTPLMSCS
ncbi:hypothetical protein BJX61DRAFT_141606 [Aspergillus egyptiacus]|nr:hypothetical protein BJX61DRAFT_141606 [Aspergillus egyptiacus]